MKKTVDDGTHRVYRKTSLDPADAKPPLSFRIWMVSMTIASQAWLGFQFLGPFEVGVDVGPCIKEIAVFLLQHGVDQSAQGLSRSSTDPLLTEHWVYDKHLDANKQGETILKTGCTRFMSKRSMITPSVMRRSVPMKKYCVEWNTAGETSEGSAR